MSRRPLAVLVAAAAALCTVAGPAQAADSGVRFTPSASKGTDRTVARRVKPGTTSTVTGSNVVRAAMGDKPLVDAAGNTWQALPPSVGTRSSATLPGDIRNTTDDARYATYAVGAQGYWLPVASSGTFRVTLGLVEPTATAPGQRVFDVVAEGRTVASGVDIFAAVGRGAAYDLTLDVPVSDGQLTIDFLPRVGVPVLSSVEVSSSGPVVPATPKQAVTFAPTNVWTRSIRTAPLATNSAQIGANVAGQVANNWGGVAAVNAYEFNPAINVATPTTPKQRIGFHDCQKKGYVPDNLYTGGGYFLDVPVPADAFAAKGTDAHMSVYDPAGDKLWDFWQMRRTAAGGWEACWGGRMDNVSQSIDTTFPKWYGSSASGMAIAGGAVTLDEVMRGKITHAVSIGILEVRDWQLFSWPANRSDGTSRDVDTAMEGQRLRLDPSLDLSTLKLSPFARLVAEAAQEYGFIVNDKSGAVAINAESAYGIEERTGANPWARLLGGPAYDAMAGFPWDRLQALPVDYGKP